MAHAQVHFNQNAPDWPPKLGFLLYEGCSFHRLLNGILHLQIIPSQTLSRFCSPSKIQKLIQPLHFDRYAILHTRQSDSRAQNRFRAAALTAPQSPHLAIWPIY